MKGKSATTVQEFLRKLDPPRREIAVTMRALINKAVPQAEETIAWGYLWWKLNGWLCAVYPAGDHINFGLSRGSELDDPEGLLEGTGKGMRHIKLYELSDIRKGKFTSLVKQAAKLNSSSKGVR